MQTFEFYWVLMLWTPGHGWNQTYDLWTKGRDYKEGQVDRKKRKVFATAYVVLRTAVMFLPTPREVTPRENEKRATNTGGKYFCLGHWLTTWRP